MAENYHIAAGLDIHKRFVQATILTNTDVKYQQRFERSMQGLLALKEWILGYKCQVVACESTSDFWVPIYDSLCDHLTVIVGNPYDMKVLSHKKTDKIDSENIAMLALKDLIRPSRVFKPFHRDFRKMVRLRQFLVGKRTDIKNRIHGIFDTEMFHLSEVLSDIFGKSGNLIMNGILEGKDPDSIILSLPSRIKNKSEEINLLLGQKISPYAIIQLGHCIRVIETLDDEIKLIQEETLQFAAKYFPRELEILLSTPGIGEVSAVILLAEIGDFNDFSTGDKLASWLGLVPKVYQSADHNAKRSITKRGSKMARWCLIQVAHAAARKKDSVFFDFYQSKKDIIGKGKAIVALARKIITIVWHLLVNDELYEDKYAKPKKPKKIRKISIPAELSLEKAIKYLCEAFQVINKPDPDLI